MPESTLFNLRCIVFAMKANTNPISSLPEWKVRQVDGTAGPSLATWRGSFGLILLFNKGCLTCKTRALPILKQWTTHYPALKTAAVHTQLGRTPYSPEEIGDLLQEYDLNFPLYLDVEKTTFQTLQGEGTPHWILLGPDGQIQRSIFGSRPNALQRIDYFIRELFPEDV